MSGEVVARLVVAFEAFVVQAFPSVPIAAFESEPSETPAPLGARI